MTIKFSFLFQFLFISLMFSVLFSETIFSQEREIFVPETQLGVLFEGITNHILIKRNEFETLRQQAREIRLEMSQDKDKPPAEAILLSSDYRVEISGLRAVIAGTLEIDVLTNDPVSIPLPLERVAVLEAVFDDSRQPVAMSDNNGQKTVILSGKQRYRIGLRLTTPLEIDATRQRLNFRLPYGTETSFRLSVSGDVELKGGAAVLLRKVENGATNFELLLPPESRNNRTEILMSLNSHRKGEYTATLVRSVQFAEVTEHYERLHATVSLNELHQGVRETSFFVPAGFEITEVRSVFLDRWNVRKSEEKSQEKDQRDVLTIRFREQVPGLTTIYLSAIKFTKIEDQWSFPSFEPLDTAVHSAVLGLLLDEDLDMSHVESNSLFPINALSLKEAIPPSALEFLPGSPTLRLVFAWYASGKNKLDKNVTAKFRRAETDTVIETVQNLILSEKEPILHYTAKITPRTGKIFETTLEIPDTWNVLSVHDAAGQPLDFRPVHAENMPNHSKNVSKNTLENISKNMSDKTSKNVSENAPERVPNSVPNSVSDSVSDSVSKKVSEKISDKIIVRFSKGVAAGESIQFLLRVTGNIRDWFQNGTEKSLQYPVIRIHGSANEQGTISVQNEFEDDWEIIPAQTEHLTALNGNLSFRYLSTPFVLPLRLEKLQPLLKAGTIAFYGFEPSLFHVRYEINCSIEQGTVRQLTLLLPASSPPTPSIQGLNGLNIKETLSEETEINGQQFRRWKILFAEPTSGKVRIGINFEQPISEQIFTNTDTATAFDLPPVLVENTEWQSGLIAVESDEELDLTIPTERNGKLVLRPVDAAELSVAVYRTGKRLLGVYSVTEPQKSITINVQKNQTVELLSALIRHVSVTARMEHTIETKSNRCAFSPKSKSMIGALYSVLYEIQTAEGTVNIRTSLKESDELWSITLDGEPIKAQRIGDDILIPVSAKNNTDVYRLVLLYQSQQHPFDVSQNAFILNFPALSINRKNGNEKIPVMQTSWNITPPFGYKINRIGDLMLQEPQPALFNLFHGVVGFFNVLTYRPVIFVPLSKNDMSILKSNYQNGQINDDINNEGDGLLLYEVNVPPTMQINDTENVQAEGTKKAKQEISNTFDPVAASDIPSSITVDSISSKSSVSEPTGEPDSVFSRMLSIRKTEPQSEKRQSIYRLQSIQPVSIIVSENITIDSVSNYSVIGSRNTQDIFVQLSPIAVGQRWGWIAFLVIVLLGLCGLGQSRQCRTMFVFGLLIFGTVLIFVPGLELFATIFNGIVYGAALTGAVYFANALRLKIVSVKVKPKNSESTISATNLVSVLFFVFLCLPIHAAEQHENLPKIQFPEDAIIVPYSSDNLLGDSLPDPDKLTLPEQSLLVPYRQYTATLELIRKQNEKNQNSQNVQNFVVPFAVSAAEYQTTLPTDGTDILLHGKINIDVFTDQTILVPLTLENGVFVQPMLDGKPAILHSTSNRQVFLHVEGNSRHELLFGIRVRIQRQGGWRIATGKLPIAAVSKISLTLPDESGDLLTSNPLDRKKWSFGTKTTDTNTDTNRNTDITQTQEKIIETSSEPNGFFHWQWRSAVSEENVDRNLEVESVIRYDIQEDGVWVRWTPLFRISRGKWELFRLCLPKDYLIAEIAGENVRGWNIVQEDTKTRTIDVELLKPAEKIETLSILLSAPQKTTESVIDLSLPNLTVPDAGIHRGQIDLFHSSAMKFTLQDSTGLSPTDPKDQTEQKSVLKFDTKDPFGFMLFRSFRFSSENYSLRIKGNRRQIKPSIQCFSVLKITRQDVSLETKIQIHGNMVPFYESILLPEKFVLKNVNVQDGILWNRESGTDKENKLNIICADSRSSLIEILIDGDFSGAFSKERNEIETLPIFKSENRDLFQHIAVLTEPSLDVRADNVNDFQIGIPDSVFSWVLQPEQRDLIRLVLRLWTSTKITGYKLILSERKPEIRCSTITNVRTTAESIEETTLLDFNIAKAGVRNIEFVLPAWMNNAKINVPFLRRKTVTPLDTKNAESPVLVRLELHEEVMEQLRVLVQTDRRLQSETDYRVFVPVIRTGQTMRQYIVMENDRRSPDEMIVDRLQHLQALNRQQSEWSYLASILGGNVTEAYFATKKNNPVKNDSDKKSSVNNTSDNNDSVNNSSVNNDPDNAANLLFRMKRRETVQLADARIDLAETRFTLGDNGCYRAEQIYRIDNKKEPYLDILLPEGATLWGARILTAAEWQQKEHGEHKNNIGLPVKPNIMPTEIVNRYNKNVTESHLIRIPLVKTESGDVDFIVRLIYAGDLQHFSGWTRLDIPFIEVLNIPVGESLVRLNLPDRYEYQFKGNLQHVRQEQESETIRQVQSNYQRQQTDRLNQVVKGKNPFASKRAKMNLEQLDMSGSFSGENTYSDSTVPNSSEKQIYYGKSLAEGQIIADNSTVSLDETHKSAELQAVVPNETETSFGPNSVTLSSNFYNQSNKFSGQLVQQKALTMDKTVNQSATKSSSSFNDQWFNSNSLSNQNVTAKNGEGFIVGGRIDANRSGQRNQLFVQSTITGGGKADYKAVPSVQQPYSVPQQQAVLPPPPPVPQPQQQPQQSQQRSVQIVQGNLILSDTTNGNNDAELNRESNVSGSTFQVGKVSDSSSDARDKRSEIPGRKNSETGQLLSNSVSVTNGNNLILGLSAQGSFSGQTSTNKNTSSTGHVASFNSPAISENNPDRRRQSGKRGQRPILALESVTPETRQSDKASYTGETSMMTSSGKINVPETVTSRLASQSLNVVNSGNSQTPEIENTEQILPVLATRTSSLDIEIPYTGKMFLFTAPQGSLDLSFRPISSRAGSRGLQILAAFLGLTLLYGIYRICFSIGNRLTFDRRTHRNIAGLVTLLSVLSLILAPLVSVLSFIFAVLLWITLFQKKST